MNGGQCPPYLLQTSLIAIFNMGDHSAIFQPQLEWELATAWQLVSGASLYQDGNDTEFGMFFADVDSTRVKVGPANGVNLWLRYYLS